jgi:HSP20 family protein
MPKDWWEDWDEARKRWEREFRKMQDEMERFFSWGGRMVPPPLRGRALASAERALTTVEPSVDLIDQDGELVVNADLPGIEKGDVTLTIKDNQLEISAERKEEAEEKKEGYLRRERTYSKFYRKLQLPTEVDEEKTKATFKSGVLEVILPKKAGKKGKKIKIG